MRRSFRPFPGSGRRPLPAQGPAGKQRLLDLQLTSVLRWAIVSPRCTRRSAYAIGEMEPGPELLAKNPTLGTSIAAFRWRARRRP
jgi:hypothetical protein